MSNAIGQGLLLWLEWLQERPRYLGGCVLCGLLGRLLWSQYGILRHKRLPPCDLGLPIFGHTLSIFRESLEGWGQRKLDRAAMVVNFLFKSIVVVNYPLYHDKIQRLELDGQLIPGAGGNALAVVGQNSILMLPAGKGHHLHKRLRAKTLACLGPKPLLAFLPDMLALIRQTLDGLAADTAARGFGVFEEAASHLAARASSIQVTAGLVPEVQQKLEELLTTTVAGLIAMPIDLGPFSSLGRAKRARREAVAIIRGLMESPNLERRNIIADLMQASEGEDSFTLDEIVDTVFTLLVAGKLTTADALPALFVNLAEQPAWAARIAAEPLAFSQSIEEDSATLRFVRESLRLKPPVGAFRRRALDRSVPIDLGEHGEIPPGCEFAVNFRREQQELGADFNPDRWTPEAARESFLIFGGSQPHACIGKSLALMELQLFARVLCREYDFRVHDAQLVVKASNIIGKTYRDGLKVSVARKTK